MRVSAALTVVALLFAVPLMTACSGGGASNLEYAPPVNFNPAAGLSPDLTNPNSLGGPSAPPFKP